MQAQPLLNKPQGSVLRRVVGVVQYEYVGRLQGGDRRDHVGALSEPKPQAEDVRAAVEIRRRPG
jgi:hypothetical protein